MKARLNASAADFAIQQCKQARWRHGLSRVEAAFLRPSPMMPLLRNHASPFPAAIADCDRSAQEEERAGDQKDRLMLDALGIFRGGKSQAKCYHGMLDAKHFLEWMVNSLHDSEKERHRECSSSDG